MSAESNRMHGPQSVVMALDAACIANDIERVLAVFAEDAVLTLRATSEVYAGKARIREWFAPQMRHFHVDSRNHRVTGNVVTWESTVTADVLREMGIDALEDLGEAIVQDGKITIFNVIVTPASLSKLQAASAKVRE